ncbi:hypothetical protein G6F40_013244 [Rhizopus arrhizus]|nr:hypothetical protein G6F40_013244 [Rhizopus arrhizus]
MLALGAVLFAISLAGIFLNRKNVIVLLMSIELMLLSVHINFVGFSRQLGDPSGQLFVFFILTVAAAEAAFALGTVAEAGTIAEARTGVTVTAAETAFTGSTLAERAGIALGAITEAGAVAAGAGPQIGIAPD